MVEQAKPSVGRGTPGALAHVRGHLADVVAGAAREDERLDRIEVLDGVVDRESLELRYPYLELSLTDTQDHVVLRRVLRPADYLTPTALRAGFAAESELPVRVMFELEGVSLEIAQKAMALASAKMPVKTKFVVREEAHTDAS